MLTRRRFAALGLSLAATPWRVSAKADRATWLRERLAPIEAAARGRLGVGLLDTADGSSFAYRGDERYPMCSTFKLMACALVLARVDRGEESLARRVRYSRRQLVAWSPVTEAHADRDGLTLGELCEGTMTRSDNTAANLILASYGGPKSFTAFARSIGDGVTRLDHTEPELNRMKPGDPRDTTSPRAMTTSVERIVLGDVLAPASRDTMQRWLLANTTGDHRVKAGLPKDWRVGDKTGTSGRGTSNDLAVIWPPGRAPLVATVFVTESRASDEAQDDAIAQVARLLPEFITP